VLRRCLLLAVLVLAALPATGHAAPLVGIGEQKPEMFADPRWRALGVSEARYMTPWDTLRDRKQRQKLDTWMTAARAAGVRVLLGFERSVRSKRLRAKLPSDGAYAREFRRMRKRYPDVRDWITWNEANHPLQPTYKRPRRVARYYGVMLANCRGCRIVGADVLDISNMGSWVRRFDRYAPIKPRIWGLHNYADTNGLRTDSTRKLLRITGSGEIWFTETGGLVIRREYKGSRVKRVYRYSQRHAARSTKHVFTLACLSPRIRRIYLYHWQAPPVVTNWDSAFLGSKGRTRPAYRTLKRQLAGGWNRCVTSR
jgi:hypothetical protein